MKGQKGIKMVARKCVLYIRFMIYTFALEKSVFERENAMSKDAEKMQKTW